MRNVLAGLLALFVFSCNTVSKKEYHDPQKLWGVLYQDVQNAGLFANPKEFWDAAPRGKAKGLLEFYEAEKVKEGFSLKAFVEEHFTAPDYSVMFRPSEDTFESYVRKEFNALIVRPKDDGGSLIPTRMRYIAGGGMYQEYNYFRSYFGSRALQIIGEDSLASDISTNCFQFIQDYGYVPYGNRSYYLGFSNVPILSLMAENVAGKQPELLPWYGNLLARDYQVWMGLADADKEAYKEAKDKGASAFKNIVFAEEDKSLNRYYNDAAGNDFISLLKSTEWAGSSRFTANGKQNATEFIPVDLNALMYHLENTLSSSFKAKGKKEYADSYTNLAGIRKSIFDAHFYNSEKGFYYDYDFVRNKQSESETLAGVFPLIAGLSSEEQIRAVSRKIKEEFLTENGLLNDLSREWGSAEMNYLTIVALRRAGNEELAELVKQRWIDLNRSYFEKNKHILPVYNLTQPMNTPKTAARIDGALAVLIILLNE